MEEFAIEAARGDRAGILFGLLQTGQDLRAHARHRIGIEARMRQRQAQKPERLRRVRAERHERDRHVVAVRPRPTDGCRGC